MATLTAVAETDLTPVRAGYAFADERAVTDFLDEHPFLLPLLVEARGRLAAQFGSSTPVRLDLVDYPEEDYRALFVRIESTGFTPAAALDRLDAFYDDWWGPNSRATRGLLQFDVE